MTRHRAKSRAAGAITAQLSQALGSFLIQVLAARELGADGLGAFAILFGAILMATALSSGLVGDSLTVLDRTRPDVRSALRSVALVLACTASLLALAVALSGQSLGLAACVFFALAMASYMLEDALRRLLMAGMRFWHIVMVDFTALTGSVLTLLVSWSVGQGMGLGVFFAAITVGQVAAAAVAWMLLPDGERARTPWRHGAIREVVSFGVWRAAQQFVRPTMLNLARWVVLVAVGASAVGELEAARVYIAPAMLIVQGVGSYLLSSYAADRERPTGVLLARADRASVALLAVSMVLGVAAALTSPLLGPFITAGQYTMSPVAVLGWAVYAASSAAVMPYASLAAVRGMAGRVLGIRVVDSVCSLGLAAFFLLALSVRADLMPLLMSVGSFIGGALCRQLVLRPLSVRENAPQVEQAG